MDENAIRSEIEKGIAQVDDTLTIDEFVCNFDKESRKLSIFFTAKTTSGETISVNTDF